jgi:hypothetical protein
VGFGEYLIIFFGFGAASTVFADFVAGRVYSAAKLTAVALACTDSGSALNFGTPTICDVIKPEGAGLITLLINNRTPMSNVPITTK